MKKLLYHILILFLFFCTVTKQRLEGKFIEDGEEAIIHHHATANINIIVKPNLKAHEQNLNSDQIKLKNILEKAAEYCEKLENMAMDYVCQENIKERTYYYKAVETYSAADMKSATPLAKVSLRLKNSKRNTYVYEYRMIKKGLMQEEKRILLKEGKKEKHVEDAELNIKGFKAQYVVYGPLGFLSRGKQEYFEYEITGQDRINGKDVIIIRATPKEELDENYYMGKIWVDENDYSILKIEWNPIYTEEYEESVYPGIKRISSWEVLYGVEKNGVRFPSRQIIEEIFTTETGRRHTKYRATIDYENYEFSTSSDYESEGHRSESCRAYQLFSEKSTT